MLNTKIATAVDLFCSVGSQQVINPGGRLPLLPVRLTVTLPDAEHYPPVGK